MPTTFALLDLPSQAVAVQRILRGRPVDEKLAWLGLLGRLTQVPRPETERDARPVYLFESTLGLRCVFFLEQDVFVFLGDNTTYTVRE
jgi:hypothetical protein